MARPQILVVEDDPAIRQGLIDALTFSDFETYEAADGEDGMQKALGFTYDLMLLDLVLPKGDGFAILEAVRRERPGQPVIVLTARGAEDDRVTGLRLGADDYVVKPFSIKELLARVSAVLRRSPERPAGIKTLTLPGGVADFGRAEMCFDDGSRVALSEREIGILRYLGEHPGRVISRDELLSRVWRIDAQHLETRTVDMHIARLREKLRDTASDAHIIQTVRGKGYRLGAESDDA